MADAIDFATLDQLPSRLLALALYLDAECGAMGPEEAARWRQRVQDIRAAATALDQHAATARAWRCFHCDEVFTTPGAARDHFGGEGAVAGCLIDRVALEEGGKPERGRGLLMALRKAEADREAHAAALKEALDSDGRQFRLRIAAELRADRAESQVAALTAERDEAREAAAKWRDELATLLAKRDEFRRTSSLPARSGARETELPAWTRCDFHGAKVRPKGPYVLLADLQATLRATPDPLPVACDHEWVMHLIQMPQGYEKPGATVCTKCGEHKPSQQFIADPLPLAAEPRIE